MPQQQENLGRALNTSEYKKIFDFFVIEIPDLLLKLVGIENKKFKSIDESLGKKQKS